LNCAVPFVAAMKESENLPQSSASGFIGSLHFTYGRGGYSTELVAHLHASHVGLLCQAVESCASKYNEQYICELLNVRLDPTDDSEVAIVFRVKGDGSLGDVQLPNDSLFELHASHQMILPVVRIVIQKESGNEIEGTLVYQLPDFLWEGLKPIESTQVSGSISEVTRIDPQIPVPTPVPAAVSHKRSLQLEGVHVADESSVIGTGGLALSERLTGASEGLRGRICFSANPSPVPQSLSKLRDDRQLEVLLEQSNIEGVRVGESIHIYDLDCVQCCKEVGLCVCETKPSAIGAGAQGSVWKYRRSSDKSFVAIKKVNSRSRFDASWRLDGEAAVMSLLAKNGSQHVIPFYGSFVDCEGFINLSMKYLGKGSLADLLSKRHRLVTPAVSVLGLHLLSALHYFHSDLKLLHRDIKPSNIMIEDDGRFILADLALVILTSTGAPSDNSLAGTIHYMSPECLNDGAASPASDLWSFGMVLLEALLGYYPLDASMALVSGSSNAAPPAALVSDNTDTSEYWRLRNILVSVQSPIYLPCVRQELDELGKAFAVNVFDFFEQCLHPVSREALHTLSLRRLFLVCAHANGAGSRGALECQCTAVARVLGQIQVKRLQLHAAVPPQLLTAC
jgi:hypothetical protein